MDQTINSVIAGIAFCIIMVFSCFLFWFMGKAEKKLLSRYNEKTRMVIHCVLLAIILFVFRWQEGI